jgi:putative ABC transport system permease protein
MLFNYLLIAARNLKKRVGPTVINIAGLTVGLAACLVLGLWVERELSFDDFHPDADRIHRVGIEARITDAMTRTASVPVPLLDALRNDIPQVERATHFRPSRTVFSHEQKALSQRITLRADSAFFDVFGGFTLMHGDRASMLDDTDAVVLTASTAQELFGRTDAVGEIIRMDEATRRVTGVMNDVPETSHVQFDAIARVASIPPVFKENWTGFAFRTFAKVTPGTSTATLQAALDDVVENRAMVDVRDRFGDPDDNFVYRLVAESLPSIHLYSDFGSIGPSGSIETVYTFSIIGIFILLLACINFMNLATARATERATEVGMRKALGAGRKQLAGQFLGEAILTTAAATVAAFIVAASALPFFNSLAGTSFAPSALFHPGTLLGAAVLIIVVGLIAGSYPSFALSRFAPAEVLKGSGRTTTGSGDRRLRKGLVVFQFAISITLIIGTLVVNEQFDYIQNKDIGIEKESLVEIQRASDLADRQDTFLKEVRRIPGVETAAAGDGIFGGVSQTSFAEINTEEPEAQALQYLHVGYEFVQTMGIDVVAGRDFDPRRAADSSAVLVNEAAMSRMGWANPDDALGRTIASCDSGCNSEVIGVVDNFHFSSMRTSVNPLVLLPRHPYDESYPESVYARLEPGASSETLRRISASWSEVADSTPFGYNFLSGTYIQIHDDVQRAGGVFSLFAGLAILVACLGLFGLATYTVQQRAKEISIRKALGATALQVVQLLSRDFVALVGMAFVAALPVAYFAMNRWLADFAFRTRLGVDVFLLAGLIALGIALLTVSTQAFRAARLNPATTLKD